MKFFFSQQRNGLAAMAHMALLLLLFLVFLTVAPAACSAVGIQYTSYGPNWINPEGVYRAYPSLRNQTQPQLPRINLAMTLPVLSTGYDWATLLTTSQFYVDMVNANGGLLITSTDTRHHLTLTWATDDNSPTLAGLSYAAWAQNASLNISNYVFVAPYTATLSLAAIDAIRPYNSPLFCLTTSGPQSFTTGYPYYVNSGQSATLYLNPSLRAWYRRVDPLIPAPTPLTVCRVLSPTITLAVMMCQGATDTLASLNATSPGRIRMVADVTLAVDATSNDLARALAPCTKVDLLILCSNLVDPKWAAAGLRTSQVRPKTLITTIAPTTILKTDADTIGALGMAMLIVGSDPLRPRATLPSALFPTTADAVSLYTSWSGGRSPSSSAIFWIGSYDMLGGFISRAASTSGPDMRTAWLAARNLSVFSADINIDPALGSNVGFSLLPAILDFSKPLQQRVVASDADWTYPIEWPWPAALEVGDPVSASFDSSGIVVSLVLSVLGSWVGQILLEQAVHSYTHGGWRYVLWLIAVSCAFGLVGVWSACVAQVGFLSLTAQTTALPISFSLGMVVLAVLPSLLLTFVAFLVLIQQFERGSSGGSSKVTKLANGGGRAMSAETEHVAQVRRQRKQELREKQQASLLNHRTHFLFVVREFSLYSLAGGVLVTVAMIVCRVVLSQSLLTNAHWSPSTSSEVLSAILSALFCITSVHWSARAIRMRSVSGFLFMAAMAIELNVGFGGLAFTWTGPDVWSFDTSSALYSGTQLSAVAAKLLAGIFAGCTCLGFVAVQFSHMQLSRNDLSLLAARLELSLKASKERLKATQMLVGVLGKRAQRYAVMLDVVNLLQPLVSGAATADASSLFVSLCSSAPRSVLPEGVEAIVGSDAEDLLMMVAHGKSVHERSVVHSATADGDGGEQGENGSAPMVEHIVPIGNIAAATDGGGGSSDALGKRQTSSLVFGSGRGVGMFGDPGGGIGSSSQRSSTSNIGFMQGTALSAAAAAAAGGGDAGTTTTCILPARASKSLAQGAAATQFVTASTAADLTDSEDSSLMLAADMSTDGVHALNAGGVSNAIMATTAAMSNSEGRSFGLRCSESHAGLPLGGNSGKSASSGKVGDLAQLLAHPICVELFKMHLTKTHSGEQLAFYLAVQRYRQLTSSHLRQMMAARLIELFVRDGSVLEINVSQAQRVAILKASKSGKGNVDVFDAAQQECLQLMTTNSLATFQNAPEFVVCKAAMVEVPVSNDVEERELLAVVAKTAAAGGKRDSQLSLGGSSTTTQQQEDGGGGGGRGNVVAADGGVGATSAIVVGAASAVTITATAIDAAV